VTLFLAVFFLLYGGMHLYAFLKAKAALSFGPGAGLILAAFMASMIAAPFLVRFLERSGMESSARTVAYVGYTWLGILFLFSSYLCVFDIYRIFISAGRLITHKDLSFLVLPVRTAFFLPLVVSLLTSLYGYFEAKNIRTEHREIKTAKIPAEVGRLRIVQISDVHLGLIVREERLKRILDIVKKADPDFFVVTGDLVDGDVCRLNGLSNMLRDINPRAGKYAITGNHEFYSGLEQAKCFIRDSGFTLLRGESVSGIINIAGVDDPAGERLGLSRKVSEKDLLSGLPKEKFTLFLKHRPLIDSSAIGLFDLQLSGHIHKGQIFPFTILTWLYYPVLSGFVNVGNGSYLYESRGAGTWGPPIRVLAPPEVAVIDLVYAGPSVR
jgi:predicted MPP superfamily phosphohydrolase